MGGLLQAIFGQVDPSQLPRRPMNGGNAPLSGDFGAPGSWSDPANYQGGGRLLDRISDDSTRHPQGFEDQAPAEGQGLRASLAEQMRQQSQPQQPSRLDQMQGQYDQLGQQINAGPKKMGMLKSLMLGALAGPKAGQAFQARNQNQQFQQNQLRERQNSLLQQIEAERRMQEEQDRLNQSEDFQERMAGQSRQFSAEHEPVQTIDTGAGPMQFDRNTRQWSPIMLNGQPVGPKAQPKPDTPEQQFIDSPEEAGKPLKQKISDYAAASQKPPQREPNPYADWKAQNPGGSVEDYLAAQSGARAAGSDAAKQTQLAQSAQNGLNNMKALYGQNTPAANYAYLMNFIGMSYEGIKGARLNRAEIERAAQTRSLPDQLQQAYDLYAERKVLTPQQKKEMMDAASALAGTYTKKQGGGNSGRRVIDISQ